MKKNGNGTDRDLLRRALHAQWTTRDGKDSTTFVTHDAIRGQITAVSPTLITVKAADGVTDTFVVTTNTKVHVKGQAKDTTSSIADIHIADTAAVRGTGTTTLTATAAADRSTPAASPAAP